MQKIIDYLHNRWFHKWVCQTKGYQHDRKHIIRHFRRQYFGNNKKMYLNFEARNISIIGAKNAIKTQQITLKTLKTMKQILTKMMFWRFYQTATVPLMHFDTLNTVFGQKLAIWRPKQTKESPHFTGFYGHGPAL